MDERLDLLNLFKLILNELKFGPLKSLIRKNTIVKFKVQYKCNKEVFIYKFEYDFAKDFRKYYTKTLDDLF